MLKTILIALGALIAGILAFAATRPNTFRVERSVQIAAPPQDIHTLLADFREWRRWSPWEHLDPEMQRTFSGAPSGEGAVYEWDGNKKAGAGRMEIVEEVPGERLVIALSFIRPFASHNTTEFTIESDGEVSRLNWAMHGPAGYMSKLMTVFASFDKMIGPDFERGLEALKQEAERANG
jgi:uncharacterized protein YndB with AHSA1/START domain